MVAVANAFCAFSKDLVDAALRVHRSGSFQRPGQSLDSVRPRTITGSSRGSSHRQVVQDQSEPRRQDRAMLLPRSVRRCRREMAARRSYRPARARGDDCRYRSRRNPPFRNQLAQTLCLESSQARRFFLTRVRAHNELNARPFVECRAIALTRAESERRQRSDTHRPSTRHSLGRGISARQKRRW